MLGPSRRSLANLYRRLAVLADGGVGIVRAVANVREQEGGRRLGAALADVERRLAGGDPLAQALATRPDAFPPLDVRMVAAGEKTGTLGETLVRLADAHERRDEAEKQLLGGLAYPIFLIHAAALILPLPALITGGGGAYLARAGPPLAALWGGAALVALAIRALRKTEGGRAAIDRIVVSTPWVGSIAWRADLASTADALGALLRSGVPMLEALPATASVARGAPVRDVWLRAEGRVRGGATLGNALRDERALPATLRDLVASGDESGQLPESLAKASQLFRQDADLALRALIKTLPVVVYLLVAAMIAWQIVSTFQTVYSGALEPLGR